jgi:hypothetical protein
MNEILIIEIKKNKTKNKYETNRNEIKWQTWRIFVFVLFVLLKLVYEKIE